MNVKNETPTGSVTLTIQAVSNTLAAELTKKPAYLKYASRPMSKPTASVSRPFRARSPCVR